MKIELYTDGSGTSMGSPGGWAFVVIVDGVKVHESSGSEENATNNTMELTAALKGLEYINSNAQYKSADITLISDSQLVLNFAKGTWECKKLHLALLAAKLNTLFKTLNAKDQWVKGHSGNEYNELCDKLAGEARESLIKNG
jgi:ribonuclease HI